MLWALEQPLDDPLAKLVLLVLADQADGQGAGAYPAVSTVAAVVPCDRATVQRKLRQLEAADLLVRGDQELVSHHRADRRPTVWNLALTGPHAAAPHGPRGRSGAPHGAADGAAPLRPDPSTTQKITRGVAARRETPDGAVAGCATHADRRRPACAECQRVQPLHRTQVRPASPQARAAARAALHQKATP